MNTTVFNPISIMFWKRVTNKVVDYGLPLLDSSFSTGNDHFNARLFKEAGTCKKFNHEK